MPRYTVLQTDPDYGSKPALVIFIDSKYQILPHWIHCKAGDILEINVRPHNQSKKESEDEC